MTFGFLKYPQQLNEGQVDYMIFTPHEYATNGAGGVGGGASGPQTGETIVLYMPNSTPSTQNANNWAGNTAEGPFKSALRDTGALAADAIYSFGDETDQEAVIDRIKSQVESMTGEGGGIAKQAILEVAAPFVGQSPNSLLAYSRGEIYNPNIELLYSGPQLREFSFNFQFIPKSEGETAMIHRIIKSFKSRSAPEDKNGMFKVPDVWEVKYMSNGKENKNMNSFKRMACVGIAVQANASTNMHQSFNDGMPISTTMSLRLQEVDIITRNDHDDSTSLQGF